MRSLLDALSQRVLLSDGAMGTQLQNAGLDTENPGKAESVTEVPEHIVPGGLETGDEVAPARDELLDVGVVPVACRRPLRGQIPVDCVAGAVRVGVLRADVTDAGQEGYVGRRGLDGRGGNDVVRGREAHEVALVEGAVGADALHHVVVIAAGFEPLHERGVSPTGHVGVGGDRPEGLSGPVRHGAGHIDGRGHEESHSLLGCLEGDLAVLDGGEGLHSLGSVRLWWARISAAGRRRAAHPSRCAAHAG